MSLDLSWSLLDDALAQALLSKLNDVLANASRPEYIGPITLSNLLLGSEAPEVDIVDVGDVWPEFLHRDDQPVPSAAAEAVSARNVAQPEGSSVRRDGHLARFANKNLPFSTMPAEGPSGVSSEDDMDDDYEQRMSASSQQRDRQRRRNSIGFPRNHRIQTYRQYSDSGHMHRVETGSMSSFDGHSSVPQSPWFAGLSGAATPYRERSAAASATGNGYFPAWTGGGGGGGRASVRSAPHSRRSSWQRQSPASAIGHPTTTPLTTEPPAPGPLHHWHHPSDHFSSISAAPPYYDNHLSPPIADGGMDDSKSTSSALPSLQLQLSMQWITQSLRITLDTSLLINHPSPAFMSLPLNITITGLSLAAGGLLAFEVDPVTNIRRSHFCLLVDEEDEGEGINEGDESGLEGGEHNVEGQHQWKEQFSAETPTYDLAQSHARARSKSSRLASRHHVTGGGRGQQPQQPSAGERILYNLSMETSVGQADKHVLKNVAKVERFVVQLVRKAIDDELVFPNFYSVELP